jgi:hypothetical protein
LQFGELPAFRGVVGKLVVGESGSWNYVRSHRKSSTGMHVAGSRSQWLGRIGPSVGKVGMVSWTRCQPPTL